MSAGPMKASFILKLEDQLTNGLVKLQERFEALNRVAAKLSVPGLVNVDKAIDTATNAAIRLSSALDRVHQAGGRAWGTLKNISKNVGVLGGAAAGYSVIEPIRAASHVDNILSHQAIFAGKSAAEVGGEVNRLRSVAAEVARTAKQPFEKVAEAGFYLQQSQMSPQTVQALLGLSAKGATAYNSNPLDVARAAFSMHENLGIQEGEIGQALGIIGTAAKLQHFQFQDYAQHFPEVATVAALKGVKGLSGATDLAAMLVTGRAGAATPGQAATNLVDFISSLSHKNTHHKFAEYGVDIEKVMANARIQGVNPLEAVLAKVQKIQAAHPNQDVIGHLFQNIQTQQFVGQLVTHVADYLEAKKHIQERANPRTLDEDFRKAAERMTAELNRFDAEIAVAHTRIGIGFSPVITAAADKLERLNKWTEELDHSFPGLVDGVLLGTASILGLLATFGVIGFAAGPIAAGFGLIAGLLAPEAALVIGLIGLAALLGKMIANDNPFESTIPPTPIGSRPGHASDEGGPGARVPGWRPTRQETVGRFQEEANRGEGEDYVGVMLRGVDGLSPRDFIDQLGDKIGRVMRGVFEIDRANLPGARGPVPSRMER